MQTQSKLNTHTAPTEATEEAVVDAATEAARAAAEGGFYGKVPNMSKIKEAAKLPLTDMGIGARMAVHYKGLIGYVSNNKGGAWYTYTGTHWEIDADGSAVEHNIRTVITSLTEDEPRYAAETDPDVRRLRETLAKAEAMGDAKMILQAQANVDDAVASAAANRMDFGRTCESGMSHIKAAMNAAQRLLRIQLNEFDTHPYLFNFTNGTMDLRTKELRPHRSADMLTKVAAVAYNPEARSADLDKILEFMDRNGEGLSNFMRLYLGSALTGLNTAKAFLYIMGKANVGKTTLIESACLAMGDVNGSGYARISSPKVFALDASKASDANEGLHRLMGARLVFADEAEKGFMNRDTVNKMAAGGNLTTRPLFTSETTWKSQIKLVFAGNAWMPLADDDEGTRARVMGMELTKRLEPGELDPDLQIRLAGREGMEAILAWQVTGAYDFLNNGASREALRVPEAMAEATAVYLDDSDPMGDFWEAEVREVEEGETHFPLTISEWHRVYTKYLHDHGQKSKMSQKQMGQRLVRRGFTAKNTTRMESNNVRKQGRYFIGLAHNRVGVEDIATRHDF